MGYPMTQETFMYAMGYNKLTTTGGYPSQNEPENNE